MIKAALIILLFITAAAFAVSYFTRRSFEESAGPAIFTFLTVEYLLGILISLSAGLWVAVALTGIAAAAAVVLLIVRRDYKLRDFFTPAFFIFLGVGALVVCSAYTRKLTSWDEFSHWGLAVKNMFELNDFITSPLSTVYGKSHPPMASMWLFDMLKLTGGYNEGVMLAGNSLLLLVPLFTGYRACRGKGVFANIAYTLVILTMPMILFSDVYSAVYVDALLGSLFAYALIAWFGEKEITVYSMVRVMLALFVLTLIKETGVIFALLAAMVIFIDIVFVRGYIKKTVGLYKEDKKIFGLIGRLLCALFVALISPLAKLSWNTHMVVSGVELGTDTSQLTLSNIVQYLNNVGPQYRYNVMDIFLDTYFRTGKINSMGTAFTAFQWTIVGTLLILAAWAIGKDRVKGRSLSAAAITVSVAAILYAAGICAAYMFVFTQYEAEGMMSYQRYLSSICEGMLLFGAVACFGRACERERDDRVKTAALSAVLCFSIIFTPMMSFADSFIFSNYFNRDTRDEMSYRVAQGNTVTDVVERDEKVYLIFQNTQGFDYWACRYNVTPIKTNDIMTWSIGEKYSDGDIWTWPYTADEWRRVLLEEDYDYMYLAVVDMQFVEQFGALFPEGQSFEAGTLFRVMERAGSDVIFEEVIG